jgi:hypothetical protein
MVGQVTSLLALFPRVWAALLVGGGPFLLVIWLGGQAAETVTGVFLRLRRLFVFFFLGAFLFVCHGL